LHIVVSLSQMVIYTDVVIKTVISAQHTSLWNHVTYIRHTTVA